MTEAAPKAFLSHATEDKERFVVPFAEKLRARGIDAWLDAWEMLPGDSIVERIFDEGIAEAAALIVVLSEASLASAWVREELNAGVVNKIDRKTKLIPVLIEDVEVPQALRATLYQRVEDLTQIDEVVDRVARAIFGILSAPVVGPPPGYVDQAPVPGLEQADATVLGVICRQCLSQNDFVIDAPAMAEACASQGVTAAAAYESLELLRDMELVDGFSPVNPAGRQAAEFTGTVTRKGLLAHLEAARPDLEDIRQQALAAVVNAHPDGIELFELAGAIGIEPLAVIAILGPYEDQGLEVDPGYVYWASSTSLRRHLR